MGVSRLTLKVMELRRIFPFPVRTRADVRNADAFTGTLARLRGTSCFRG